jgi:replication factor A1
VTNKSDIRRWSNAKGDGTLFNVDLLDEHGGEIRGTFFKGETTIHT